MSNQHAAMSYQTTLCTNCGGSGNLGYQQIYDHHFHKVVKVAIPCTKCFATGRRRVYLATKESTS